MMIHLYKGLIHLKSICWVLVVLGGWMLNPSIHAQKFDQNYAQWKAQQEAIDSRLAPQQLSNAKTPNKTTFAVENASKISLNSADLNQLKQLNGVGEKKAQAIIDYRRQAGGFKHIEDIQKVKGIGPALFEKNKARLKL